MKRFKDIHEGLLSGQEEVIKSGDATVKEMAFAKEVVSIVSDLEDLNYKNVQGNAYRTRGHDINGKKIQKGDLVMFNDGNTLQDDGLQFGIVVEEQMHGVGYTVIVGVRQYEEDEELDLYPNCFPHYVDACNMVVIARQKDTIKMIKHFKNLK